MDLLTILLFTTPIAVAALGETIGQKSGIINIGLEGTMLVGAFFGMLATHYTGNPLLGLLAGTLCGAITTIVSGWFCVKLAADQVVVGTAVNLLALGVTGTLFRSVFGQGGKNINLPPLPSLLGIDPVMAFLILAVPGVWFFLARTRMGLAIRSVGEYPKAAEASGFSVDKLRITALVIAGVFGGLAGAHLCLGVSNTFAENMTLGRGFIAIALVTFGRWNPFFVFGAAMLVGWLDSLQYRVQSSGSSIPFQLLLAMPYIVALVVLVLVGKGTLAPAALAQSYRREK